MIGRAADFARMFRDAVGKPLELAVWLSAHSHFRIGGKADYFFSASSVAEIERAVVLARECAVPCYVIGGGYNLLFHDEGFRGLILKNCVKGLERKDKCEIAVFSGTDLMELLQFCCEQNLGGVEYLAGIPGTVGGAVFGNAGAFDQDIGSHVVSATLFDEQGHEKKVERGYFDFDYRSTRLRQKHEFVLSVTLWAEERNKDRIKAAMDEILEKRKKKHPPWHVACAGSFFRNPVLPDGRKVPAAQLLDRVGAKELSVGNAAVYEGHANFLINRGNATSADVCQLAQELKRRVKQEFAVELQEEVIIVPAVL